LRRVESTPIVSRDRLIIGHFRRRRHDNKAVDALEMLNGKQLDWLQRFVGFHIDPVPLLDDPTDQAGGGGVSAPPADSLPQPMQPDCKIVRGQVPGPKNFVLCAMHGHILDLDKKLIVARDLKEFEAQHPEYGKLPVPMLPDCVIVRDKVPGPKHHVLCGTHGHVIDEEKKQIIAHTLDEYKRQHSVAKPAASHGTDGKPPAASESMLDKEPGDVLKEIVDTIDEPAMSLATALKALPNFPWNTARDGCAAEIKALEKEIQPIESRISLLQGYIVAFNKRDPEEHGVEWTEIATACRSMEEEIDRMTALLNNDELGRCLRQRAGTYQIDTGSNDPTVAAAMKQYEQQKQAVVKALAALRPPMHHGHEWGKWVGELKS
jgi:hypothetical protein